MTGLLDGMRVLDVSMWRPMPHATQILCDLGAEVLKVERPGGDPMRLYPEIFAGVARGKRSIELDLKSHAGFERALELVAECDVFCESFRPGVAERLGLGSAQLRVTRPELIYCSNSGYGQTGPWRDMPGHDLNFEALGGAIAPREGESPVMPSLPVADLEAGTMAAVLICAAWSNKIATGEGETIDVAMADVVAWWVGPRTHVKVAGTDSKQPGSPGYGIFETADGGWITLAPLNEQHLWTAICEALGLDGLALLSFAERLQQIDSIRDAFATAIGELSSAAALDRLSRAGAPVAPALTPEQAAMHPQLVDRGVFTKVGDVTVPTLPSILSEHKRESVGRVPEVGGHEGFALDT